MNVENLKHALQTNEVPLSVFDQYLLPNSKYVNTIKASDEEGQTVYFIWSVEYNRQFIPPSWNNSELNIIEEHSVFAIKGITDSAPLTEQLIQYMVGHIPLTRRTGMCIYMPKDMYLKFKSQKTTGVYTHTIEGFEVVVVN